MILCASIYYDDDDEEYNDDDDEEYDASLLFSVKWYEENPNYWPLISENPENSAESCDQTPPHSVPYEVG